MSKIQEPGSPNTKIGEPGMSDGGSVSAAAAEPAEGCPTGTHWDGKNCVADNLDSELST